MYKRIIYQTEEWEKWEKELKIKKNPKFKIPTIK